jgi:hypothetical protein
LAQDLGPFGITANSIVPGVIPTGRIMQTVIPRGILSIVTEPSWSLYGGSGQWRMF